jgi:hypothetical protein
MTTEYLYEDTNTRNALNATPNDAEVVCLYHAKDSHFHWLTPDTARALAVQLNEAADAVEAKAIAETINVEL